VDSSTAGGVGRPGGLAPPGGGLLLPEPYVPDPPVPEPSVPPVPPVAGGADVPGPSVDGADEPSVPPGLGLAGGAEPGAVLDAAVLPAAAPTERGGSGFAAADAITNAAAPMAQTIGTSRVGFDTGILPQNPGEPNSANV
jgi:hypothetical protein